MINNIKLMTVKQFIRSIKRGDSRASEIAEFTSTRNLSRSQIVEMLEEYATVNYFEGVNRGKDFVVDVVLNRNIKFNTSLKALKHAKK